MRKTASILGTSDRSRATRRGTALLMVLIIVGVIFTVGLAAVTAATRDTRAGRNFAAYSVALQAAQSGVEVARRRIAHPWDVNYGFGQNWPGTGGYVALPAPDDGKGARMDAYYSIALQPVGATYVVTSTGLAVMPGGSAGTASHILATRAVRAVIEKPKIEVPYCILSQQDLYLPNRLVVNGDVFCNGNATVAWGAYVSGKLSAVGTISNSGLVLGGTSSGVSPGVTVPPILYYIYRPTYSYGGGTYTAIELSGNSLGSKPPTGMPGNPNNVFYSNANNNFTTTADISLNGATIVTMYNFTVTHKLTVVATAGFPSLIINGDLLLNESCELTTEGLVWVRGKVRQLRSDGSEDWDDVGWRAKWSHKGPLVFGQGGNISTWCHSEITIDYDISRTGIQPLNSMVLPVKVLSYSEN